MKRRKPKIGFKKIFLIILPTAFVILTYFARMNATENERDALTCPSIDLTGYIDPNETIAVYQGKQIEIPQIAFEQHKTPILGVSTEERWIEVDLSEQKLRAWEGGQLYLETPVSTGLRYWPTPQGEFRIWAKLRATKMEGGSGRYYYYLPNVPYVMYFENSQTPAFRGYGLHGTYWHNNFGTPRSHGCVNLPTSIAEKLYYWTVPSMPDGKSFVQSSSESPGTRIVIHE